MKKISRKVILFLCFVMVFSLTACSKTENNIPVTKDNSTSPKDPYEKTLDITWLGFFCAGLPQEFWAKTEIEKMFNVKITVPDVDANADIQKVNLMVASGEMPDFFASATNDVQRWFDEEVTRSIPIEIVKKAAPIYSSVMNQNQAGWKLYAMKDKPNELMALTGFTPGQATQLMTCSFYRLDWLERIGIKPHGTLTAFGGDNNVFIADEGFTRDEFLTIMDKFVNNDPDGNGEKDTLGFVGSNALAHTWYSLMGSFGLSYNNLEENGKTIEYYSSAKYKEFLKFAATLYKNGYMDREFFTNDWTRMQEKYSKQKAGYISTQPSYLQNSDPSMWNRAPLSMIKDNPNGKIVLLPPEIGPNGEQGVQYNTNIPFKYYFYIGNGVDDEKLERILNIFDYAACSKEGYIKMSYGEEGVHYTMNDTEYGKIRVQQKNIKPGFRVFSLNMFQPLDGRNDINTPPEILKLTKDVMNNPNWTKYLIGPYRLDLFNQTDLLAVKAEVSGTIDSIVNEFYAKSIAGEINIDSEWNNYINNLNKAGYQKIVTELNKAPTFKEVMGK